MATLKDEILSTVPDDCKKDDTYSLSTLYILARQWIKIQS